MSQSPWSAYGRPRKRAGEERPSDTPDLTFGAAREVMRTQEHLKRYLAQAMQEYHEIRAGRSGYGRIVAEALKPAPRPETIEETLRRLSGARPGGRHPDSSDPSSTV